MALVPYIQQIVASFSVMTPCNGVFVCINLTFAYMSWCHAFPPRTERMYWIQTILSGCIYVGWGVSALVAVVLSAASKENPAWMLEDMRAKGC